MSTSVPLLKPRTFSSLFIVPIEAPEGPKDL